MEAFCPNLPHPWGGLGQGSGTLGHHPFVLDMIYIDNYSTGFMILGGMVCITILSIIVSLTISIFRKFSKYYTCLLRFISKVHN